jgi:hypothetical protein
MYTPHIAFWLQHQAQIVKITASSSSGVDVRRCERALTYPKESINIFKPKINLNSIYIFIFYLTENTLRLHYKAEPAYLFKDIITVYSENRTKQ